MRKTNQNFATMMFVIAFVIVPLFFENRYFNMLQAKAHIYWLSAGVMLIGLIVVGLKEKTIKSVVSKPHSLIDWFMFVTLVVTIISCLLSGHIRDTFLGSQGWMIGAFATGSIIVIYFFLKDVMNISEQMWQAFICINMAIFLIAILHGLEIDVLGLHSGIAAGQYHWYLTTIGNMNWYAAYLCMIVPMLVIFYMECKTKQKQMMYGAAVFLACFSIVLCISDLVYLGIGSCAFLAIPYVLKDEIRLQRFFQIVIMYAIGLLCVSVIPRFEGVRNQTAGIAGQLLDIRVIVILLLIGFCGIIIIRGRWERFEYKRIVIVVLEVILASVAIALLINAIHNYDDSWGTKRGLIWRYSFDIFYFFDLKRKLIGIGPEMLNGYYQELSTHFSRKVLVSHSEPIQTLLTTGILGLICWIGLRMSLIASFLKRKVWRGKEILFALPLLSFIGQSFVSCSMITTFVVFYVILIMYVSKSSK